MLWFQCRHRLTSPCLKNETCNISLHLSNWKQAYTQHICPHWNKLYFFLINCKDLKRSKFKIVMIWPLWHADNCYIHKSTVLVRDHCTQNQSNIRVHRVEYHWQLTLKSSSTSYIITDCLELATRLLPSGE